MREETILILEREDLKEMSIGRDLFRLTFLDTKISEKVMRNNGIILFIDENGDTKILKNRYGDKGQSQFLKVIDGAKNIIKEFY